MELADLLRDQVALVTGAGRGIGRGIALALAAHGASVGVNDVQEEAVEKVVQEITGKGGRAVAACGSVADAQQVDAFVTEVEEASGPVDILVNNAGINRDSTLLKMTEEQWRLVIDVDLTGQFFCMKRVLPGMRQRERGRIINVSSGSWLGNFGQANYAAAKAGIIGLTKTASRELAKYGITANAICPGFIDTEMTRSVPANVWNQMVSKIPAGRVGTPEDVGSTVVWLASPYAAYITGEVLNVGGGLIV
jgi:3-oxoacyl-[acyl-carrier protein] reductase/2-hydroxycyclohexanecarboxyl-CoA dehydrogenase